MTDPVEVLDRYKALLDECRARLSAAEQERDQEARKADFWKATATKTTVAAHAAEDRAEAAEGVVEAARKVDRIYEGLRVDANDGTFALWSEDDLISALHHELRPALAVLDESQKDSLMERIPARAVLGREGEPFKCLDGEGGVCGECESCSPGREDAS